MGDWNEIHVAFRLGQVSHEVPVDAFIRRTGSVLLVCSLIHRFISEDLIASPLRAGEEFPVLSSLQDFHCDQREELESQAVQTSTDALKGTVLSDRNPRQTLHFSGMSAISRMLHLIVCPNALYMHLTMRLMPLYGSSRLLAYSSALRPV